MVRKRWLVAAVWIGLTVALAIFTPAADPRANEPQSFLPESMPSQQAVRAINDAFGAEAGLSQAVVVFERTDDPATEAVEQLTDADLAAIEGVAERLNDPNASDTQSPELIASLRPRSPNSPLSGQLLVSPAKPGHGQAAIVMVQIPANYITLRAADVVDHALAVLDQADLPAGLSTAVTGSAAFGHDYALAAERSHERTLWVTIVAVVLILLVVYRAPLAAAVPLGAISIAAVLATCVLSWAGRFGMHVGAGERIFVYVLLYGAGVDYSLFILGRYREYLASGARPRRALADGLSATGGAILASAGTTVAGMLMLTLAQFRIFRTVGPAVALALAIGLAAALSLVPAMTSLIGHRLFWPGWSVQAPNRRRLWPAVARWVSRKPRWALGVVLLALAAPCVQGVNARWVFDTLADVRGDYSSARGAELIRRHWPVGELAPVTVLVRSPGQVDLGQWRQFSRSLTDRLLALEGVSDVRSLSRPLGAATDRADVIRRALLQAGAGSYYVGDNGHAMRLTMILADAPFSNAAMATVERAAQAGRAESAGASEVLLAGATAETADLRVLTRRDFHLVAVAALAVIAVIVLMLLRDAVAVGILLAGTILGYLATLGLTYWIFGSDGLDWKVQVFLFVVMVAVGQDYNIYLCARLAQEARGCSAAEAVRRAIVATGGIISSCGLIMAATLGSLVAGDLTLLRQLGVALALGMLIDTFAIRPLLAPALLLLTGRARKLGQSKLPGPRRAD